MNIVSNTWYNIEQYKPRCIEMNSTEDKLKNHPTFIHADEIKDICKPLELLNITSFSNMRLLSDTSFVALSSNPEFSKNYILQEHYKADVHVDPKHCHLTQCLMWDHIDTKGAAEQMVKDAAELNCKHIFSIIKIGQDEVNYYNFGTALDDRAINQLYVNHYDLLEKFIAYFHDKVSQSKNLKKAYDIQFDIDKPLTSTEQPNLLQLDNATINEFLNAIGKNTYLSQKLTLNEFRLLPFIINGHTAKEIASLLGLSFRTVEGYLDIIKQKLHARNKADLISKLLQLQDS